MCLSLCCRKLWSVHISEFACVFVIKRMSHMYGSALDVERAFGGHFALDEMHWSVETMQQGVKLPSEARAKGAAGLALSNAFSKQVSEHNAYPLHLVVHWLGRGRNRAETRRHPTERHSFLDLLRSVGANYIYEAVDSVLTAPGNCIPFSIATLMDEYDSICDMLHHIHDAPGGGRMCTYSAWRHIVNGMTAGRGLPPNRPGRWLLHSGGPEAPHCVGVMIAPNGHCTVFGTFESAGVAVQWSMTYTTLTMAWLLASDQGNAYHFELVHQNGTANGPIPLDCGHDVHNRWLFELQAFGDRSTPSPDRKRLRLGSVASITESFRARRAARETRALPKAAAAAAADNAIIEFFPKLKSFEEKAMLEMLLDPPWSSEQKTVFIMVKCLVKEVALSNFELSDEQRLALVLLIDGDH